MVKVEEKDEQNHLEKENKKMGEKRDEACVKAFSFGPHWAREPARWCQGDSQNNNNNKSKSFPGLGPWDA